MFRNSAFHVLGALTALSIHYTSAHPLDGRAAVAGDKNVIIQMFEWNWDSIAAECTNFIGPAGYGYVQVSPPQETIQGSQWTTDYQPVSYTLTGKRGNRSQFSNMVTTCHSAGVKVLVDTVWNHMTATTSSGTGTAGSSYSKYNYPSTYSTADFHYCTQHSDHQIQNYQNAAEVQTCELVNLADLATNMEYVRSRLAQYGDDLISLGVDGFRLDAAKHMNPSDISNILSRLSKDVYISQEVIWGSGDAVQPSQYTRNGQVQEFRYTNLIYKAFSSNGASISQLQNLDSKGWISGSDANVFVTNHDTERGSSTTSLNYNSPSNQYTNAMIFSLAHPYGTPTILSSYTMSSYDGGAPNNKIGTCSGNTGSHGWICQHRWLGVAGMVGFHNIVGSAAMTNWVSPATNRIAFGRGSAGFIAINNADSAWTTSFSTSLSAGTYCNVINGAATSTASGCSGGSFTVSSIGSFSATVPARSSIAIHIGQKVVGGSSGSPSTVQVTFAPTVTTVVGENVFVVGSISQLGTWSAASAVALSPSSYPVWKASVTLPAGTTYQYKYIKKEANGSVIWESDPNRQGNTPNSDAQTLNDSWR